MGTNPVIGTRHATSRRQPLVWSIAAATLGLALPLGVPAGASAAPAATAAAIPRLTGPAGTDSPEVQRALAAQRPYSEAANRIQTAIVASGATGYAGIAIRADRVELWWKGTLPDQVQRVVGQQKRLVKVDVKAARHSRIELEAKADRLAAAMRADPASSMNAVRIPVDGSRVTAVFDRGTATGDAKAKAQATASRAASGRAAASEAETADDIPADDIPVEVVEDERIEAASGTFRYHDGWDPNGPKDDAGWATRPGPFSGGAKINNPDTGYYCTTGFGVVRNGLMYLLTASHCGKKGGWFENGAFSYDKQRIGPVSDENTEHDIMLIPAPADRAIWDGNADGEFMKYVTGWEWTRSGEMVCQSGATSGAVCGFYNTDNYTWAYCDTDMYGTHECYYDLITAETSGWEGTRGGDSGGPVFVPNGSNVTAKGITSGRGKNGARLIYQDFGTARQDFGIDPITW